MFLNCFFQYVFNDLVGQVKKMIHHLKFVSSHAMYASTQDSSSRKYNALIGMGNDVQASSARLHYDLHADYILKSFSIHSQILQ